MTSTFARTISSVILLCISAGHLYGQEQLRHGGYNKPNIMAGASYDSYFDSALFDQFSLQLSLAPSMLSSLPVISDSKHMEQGSLLDLTVRLERDTSMHSRIRWKGTLLDYTWTSRQYPMDWKYRDVPNPLDLDNWYHSSHILAGLTLLSYDRSSPADLDARWLHARGGAGGEHDIMWVQMAVAWKLMAGIGATTFQLGDRYHADLGPNADIQQSGPEAGADLGIVLKPGIVGKYGPYMRSLGLRGDLSVRHLFATLPLSIATFGVSLTYMTSLAARREMAAGGSGIEGIIRFERQIVRFDDREEAIERLQIGAQYSFW